MLEKWFEQIMNIEVEITRTWIIRDRKNPDAKARIGATCGSKETKVEIMKKKSSLKEEVYINNNLTWLKRQNKNIT